MQLTQHALTQTAHYSSVTEIRTKAQEQMWIKEYVEGEEFASLVDLFEHEVGNPEDKNLQFVKTEFTALELFVLSSVEGRIDLHVQLEPGEKAILYGLKDDDHPFWNEVMLLLLLNANGEVEKTFFFNDEYYDLFENLEEMKEECEGIKVYLLQEEGLTEAEAELAMQEESFYYALQLAEQVSQMTDITKPHVHVIVQDNN